MAKNNIKLHSHKDVFLIYFKIFKCVCQAQTVRLNIPEIADPNFIAATKKAITTALGNDASFAHYSDYTSGRTRHKVRRDCCFSVYSNARLCTPYVCMSFYDDYILLLFLFGLSLSQAGDFKLALF